MDQGAKANPEITQLLASALQLMPEAVLVTEVKDGSERIIFLNQAFERLTGYSMDELRGQDPTVLHSLETESLHQLLSSANSEGLPQETVLHRKDGTRFQDRITVSRWRTGGKLYSVQGHADVTQQREIENQLVLSQKREATGHLVSGLAHDFNNLLTAILVYSGLMAPKLENDAQLERYLGEIRAAAERGAQVVAELMNLGREDAAEPEMVDLGEVLGHTSDLLKRILGEDVRLNTVIEPNLYKAKVHEGRIQQVLLNLGINAKDAMPNGGEFRVGLSNQETPPAEVNLSDRSRCVLIEVRDSGTGMDSETCANIFKPFFSTKGKGKGTGLGLFTARTIIEHYHGRICVESQPGKGTTFKILLPASGAVAPVAGSKATLLLVEAEEVDRKSLDATLSQRGYKVLPAADSNQALEVAQSYSGEIALLLANIRMSGIGGPQLGEEILKVRPKIKLLFMDAQGNGSQRRIGDASNFVKKPFSPSVLVHKIEEVLNSPAS
ncbi:MAG TPA: ATP-binding protein [Candidatus Angelobacter sp.]